MDDQRASRDIDQRSATLAVSSPRSPIALLASRPAVGVTGETTIAEAAGTMTRERVSALVVDAGAAIVTERDLARGVAAGCDTGAAVATLATPHPLTVDGTTSVVRATEIMLNQELRHLLVRLPDDVIGVISLRDLVAVLLQFADPQLWVTSLRVTVDAPEIWIG